MASDSPPPNNRRAFLAGFAATAATAGLAAPTPARADGPGDFEDVRRHGAVGDGQADDTDAIQRAIRHGEEHGHPVLFTPGTYRVTRTLRVRDQVDLYGTDASFCTIRHDLRGADAAARRANAVCVQVENEGDPDPRATRYVSIRRLRLTTSEPRADLGENTPQTGLAVRNGYWNFRLQETVVQDFALGVHLADCWTARVQYCSVERSLIHCLRWENATAGELTGCRLDCVSGTRVTGRGGDCAYVTFTRRPPWHETLALSVANNSFQNAEGAGFRGIGVGNVTFTNNFFENNNRAGRSAVLFLGEAPPAPASDPERRIPRLRMVNLVGGFVTPGSHGRGPAVCIGEYEVVNLMGLDLRGRELRRGLHLFGARSRVNVTGCISALENYVRSPELHVQGSVLPLLPRERSRD